MGGTKGFSFFLQILRASLCIVVVELKSGYGPYIRRHANILFNRFQLFVLLMLIEAQDAPMITQ